MIIGEKKGYYFVFYLNCCWLCRVLRFSGYLRVIVNILFFNFKEIVNLNKMNLGLRGCGLNFYLGLLGI